jgi:hypothetical protein
VSADQERQVRTALYKALIAAVKPTESATLVEEIISSLRRASK